MYIDLFRAQGQDFLLTYTKPINHLVVSPVPKADLVTLRRTLRIHRGVCGQQKIRVAHIYSDNEKGIVAMMNDFAGAGITTHFAGPGMHVDTIERQIRAVKEGVSSVLAGLCFDCCELLFKYLVAFTVSRMNMFPDSTRTDNLSAFSVQSHRQRSIRLPPGVRSSV